MGSRERPTGRGPGWQPSGPAWRRWVFRGIGVLVLPALLLGLLELGLRIGGYGYTSSAVVPCRVEGRDAFCDNVKFGWRFFPAHIARELRPFVFSAEKDKSTCRIFVLGASAAKGTPEPAYAFGRFLEMMLSDAYPGVRFEVHIAASVAINSHAVLRIAKDCARHSPDLFVVYLGHNEVVGPYGAGTVFHPLASSLWIVRLELALKKTRLGQLISEVLSGVLGVQGPAVWRGMEMFLKHQVRGDDPRLETVYRHFERNLQEIRDAALAHGAKIIFCTLATNLKDCPPFASLHRNGISDAENKEWEELYRQGIEREKAGDFARAVDRYLAASSIDGSYADLHFRLGRCLEGMKEFERARVHYVMARESDTLRFRADSSINHIIRRVAGDGRHEGVLLADIEEEFNRLSPNGIPGRELFYEHVHPTFKGNYLLAGAVCKQAEALLPKEIRNRRVGQLNPLSLAKCSLNLAYTDWDRDRILHEELIPAMEKPPFTNQLYHRERMEQMRKEMALQGRDRAQEPLRHAVLRHRHAVQASGSDFCFRKNYADLLLRSGDLDGAMEQYRFLTEHFPLNPAGYSGQGFLYLKRGEAEQAIGSLRRALALLPTSAYANELLGRAYWAWGRLDVAMRHYAAAIGIQPDYHAVYETLNRQLVELFREGRHSEAIPIAERFAALHEKALGPDHGSLAATLNNLASFYDAQGEYRKAEPLYLRALAIKQKTLGPNHPSVATSMNNLAGLYSAARDGKRAEELYSKALQIQLDNFGPEHPVVAQTLGNLGLLHASQKEYEKALRFYERALSAYGTTVGFDSPHLLNVLKNLTELYRATGETAKADDLLRRMQEIKGRNPGMK